MDLPQRIELHAFESLTLSDGAFLRGAAAEGRPALLTAALHLPVGAGPHPLVVLMHGSGGIGSAVANWTRQVTALGAASLVMDGFTGRGLTSTSTQQALLGRLNFILDIYRALEKLAAHPAIDPKRVILLGFSRGGQATLYAALSRFQALWNRSGITPMAHLAFYPDCSMRFLEETILPPVPVRVFHGLADDYNPPHTARAYVERLRAAGVDARFTAYAGGHHGFDNPLSETHQPATGSQSLRDCTIEERAPGVLINACTGAPFSYADACVRTDPHAGGHPAAAAAARRDIGRVLGELLGSGYGPA
ncbi:dienelactone hydrolase family protein [Roseomonas sp. GC11]|uniref:dienelactone hydrolase family protein n=1 Tax=Roseomonas sp. GC11 TaxID=2950546 RepID=UPI00210B98E8|nr:dienelactone hydrolase family protein [Roseomonas sp. GC11]MCQ4159654.1 dienelactone hydrolase family protein [Roseomonas sp. GC11]